MTFLVVLSLVLVARPALANDASVFEFMVNTFSTTTFAQMLVTDPPGRQTGRLGLTGLNVHNIPGSSYVVESIGDDVTGEHGGESAEFGLTPVIPGTYTVVIFGLANSRYSLTMAAYDSSGHLAPPTPGRLRGYLTAGTTRQYIVEYDPAPGAPKSVVKVVTFSTLRQDLQTVFVLGQIGDAEFVRHLDKILAEGQKALAKKEEDGDDKTEKENERKKEAVERLGEFIHQLEEAARQRPEEKQEAKEAEKHEKEPEVKKRFVSGFALKALTSDAKTLIQQLGGQPGKEDDTK